MAQAATEKAITEHKAKARAHQQQAITLRKKHELVEREKQVILKELADCPLPCTGRSGVEIAPATAAGAPGAASPAASVEDRRVFREAD